LFVREKVEAVRKLWFNSTGETMSQKLRDNTRVHETQRRHALEERDKVLAAVQDLEIKLEIAERWQPSSAKWQATAEMVVRRAYQRSLDQLEGLVISRMFELTKMNQSQTGMPNTSACDSFLIVSRIQNAKTHCQGPSGKITGRSHSDRSLQCRGTCSQATSSSIAVGCCR